MSQPLFAVRCSLFAIAVSSSVSAQGTWGPGVNHPGVAPWPTRFEAINMAVIPNGQGSEKVIVWDKNEQNQNVQTNGAYFNGGWPQRFAVGDPETNTWQNYTWAIPRDPFTNAFLGDLFCAGQTWLPDGRLFVAGGNTVYGNTPLPPPPTGLGWAMPDDTYYGSQIAAIWNPNLPRTQATNWGWTFLPPMRVKRWYPMVTLLANNSVLVSGGSETYPILAGDLAENSYEVFNLANGLWDQTPPTITGGYPGPVASNAMGVSKLYLYPRMHLLTNNRVFMTSPYQANRLWHDFRLTPPVLANWDTNPTTGVLPTPGWPPAVSMRFSGASVLLPQVGIPGNTNTVMTLGGSWSGPNLATDIINAIQVSPTWSSGPQMLRPRDCLNAVLLPNGEVLAIGGATNGFASAATFNPSLNCEIGDAMNGWRLDAAQSSPRGYHSTAALLPNGKVVSGGSDVRNSDYEVYSPAYLKPPAGVLRPAFAGPYAGTGLITWSFGTTQSVDVAAMPTKRFVQRVVLMRPCSTTHHSEFDQRYVEVSILQLSGTGVTIQAPAAPITTTTVNQVPALPGHYILFLVSNDGYVSDGRWVRLQ